MMNRRTPVLIAILSLVMLISAARSYAGLFDQDPRDFALSSVITGYESNNMFGEPASLALDERSGTIYIADSKAGVIDVFTLQGVPVSQYGSGNDLKSPIGVAVDDKGCIYVSERDGGPIKVINRKDHDSKIDIPAGEDKVTPKPGRMTFDKDGNLYVVDQATNCILVMNKDLKLDHRIGSYGKKRGQFKSLQDVAVDRQGRVYALDSTGVPVQVFDKKGKYLYRMGFQGDDTQDISLASGLFIDQNDQIWIVDKGQHSLKVFDRSGTFLRKFGYYGTGESTLYYPIDAGMDKMGKIYVLESGGRRLQIFSLLNPYAPFTPPGL